MTVDIEELMAEGQRFADAGVFLSWPVSCRGCGQHGHGGTPTSRPATPPAPRQTAPPAAPARPPDILTAEDREVAAQLGVDLAALRRVRMEERLQALEGERDARSLRQAFEERS